MNIERHGAGNPPRIDRSPVTTARAGAVDGGSAVADGEPPSFAAVLNGLDAAPRGRPGTEPSGAEAQDATAGAGTGWPEPVRSPDAAAALLAGGAGPAQDGLTDATVPADGLVDVSLVRGFVPLEGPSGPPARPVGEGPGGTGHAPGDLQPAGLARAAIPMARPGAAASHGDPGAQASGAGQQLAQQHDGSVGHHAGSGLANGSHDWAAAGDAAPGRASLEAVGSDGRAVAAVQAERAALSAVPLSDAAGGGFKPLPGLSGQRSAERIAARSVFVPLEGTLAANGAATVYSAYPAAGSMGGAAPDAPFPAGASSEVAHKVHYWITRGAQNAELQLEAFAGGAMDVSISLRGNEAQVEFRSDLPEARRLLNDAMPQLRELLRSEGLELSGGFVGGAADQQRQQERDHPRGQTPPDTGRVLAPGEAGGRSTRAPATQSHTLDVFV